MDDEASQEVRQIIVALEVQKRQLQELGNQANMIEQALEELNQTVEALDSIQNLEPGVEVMLPVGAGSYMKAELKDTKNVLVGIGGSMSSEKKIQDAVDTLKARKDQLTESHTKIQKTMGDLSVKIAELNRKAESLMGQQR